MYHKNSIGKIIICFYVKIKEKGLYSEFINL